MAGSWDLITNEDGTPQGSGGRPVSIPGTILDLAGDPPQYRVHTDRGIYLVNHDQLRPYKP